MLSDAMRQSAGSNTVLCYCLSFFFILLGAFNVEMKRDSQKDKIFHCRYNPHEPGTYTINVRWSGHHVGKSPYRIHLGVSQEDLERFLLEMQADSMADTLLY